MATVVVLPTIKEGVTIGNESVREFDKGAAPEENFSLSKRCRKFVNQVVPSCRRKAPREQSTAGESDEDGEENVCCHHGCLFLRRPRQPTTPLVNTSLSNRIAGSPALSKTIAPVDPEAPLLSVQSPEKGPQEIHEVQSEEERQSAETSKQLSPIHDRSLEDISLSHGTEHFAIGLELPGPPAYLNGSEFAQQIEGGECSSSTTSITRVTVLLEDEKRRTRDKVATAIKDTVESIRKRLVGSAAAAASAVTSSPKLFRRRPAAVILTEQHVEVTTKQDGKVPKLDETRGSQPEETVEGKEPETTESREPQLQEFGVAEVQTPEIREPGIEEPEIKSPHVEQLHLQEPEVSPIKVEPLQVQEVIETEAAITTEVDEGQKKLPVVDLVSEVPETEEVVAVLPIPKKEDREEKVETKEEIPSGSFDLGCVTSQEFPEQIASETSTPKVTEAMWITREVQKLPEAIRWVGTQTKKRSVKVGQMLKKSALSTKRIVLNSPSKAKRILHLLGNAFIRKKEQPISSENEPEEMELLGQGNSKDRIRQQDHEIWSQVTKPQLRALYATIQTSIVNTPKEKLVWLGTLLRILCHRASRHDIDDPVRGAALDGNVVFVCLKILEEATAKAKENELVKEQDNEHLPTVQPDDEILTTTAIQVLQESVLNDIGVTLFGLYEGPFCVVERLKSWNILNHDASHPNDNVIKSLKAVYRLLFATCGELCDCSHKWVDAGIIDFARSTLRINNPDSPFATDTAYIGLAFGSLRVLASRDLLPKEDIPELLDCAMDKLVAHPNDAWVAENALALLALTIARTSSLVTYLNEKEGMNVWKVVVQRCEAMQNEGHVLFQGFATLKEACVADPDVIVPRVIEAGAVKLVDSVLPSKENIYVENLLPTAIKLKQMIEPCDFEVVEIQSYVRSTKHYTSETPPETPPDSESIPFVLHPEEPSPVPQIVDEQVVDEQVVDEDTQGIEREGQHVVGEQPEGIKETPVEIITAASDVPESSVTPKHAMHPEEQTSTIVEDPRVPREGDKPHGSGLLLDAECLRTPERRRIKHTLRIANSQRQVTPRSEGSTPSPLDVNPATAHQDPITQSHLVNVAATKLRRRRPKRKPGRSSDHQYED